MTNMYQRFFAGIAITAGILGLSACSDKQSEPADYDGEHLVVNFSRSGDESLEQAFDDVDIYIFRGNTLVKTIHSDDPQSEPIRIKDVGDGMVYAISGLSLDVTVGQTTVADMDNLVTNCSDGAASAPLFFSGYAPLNKDVYSAGILTLEPVRSVARIDLVNEVDKNITVNEIIIENAPKSTLVFAGPKVAEGNSIRFEHSFAEPMQARSEGVFTIFESAEPVEIRVRGFYGETPMDMTTSLSRVERNKIYTLQVVNAGSKVETSFSVKDWEDGNTVGAGPDMKNGITIDPEYSVIPAGVQVDYENNIVTVPYAGVNGLKLAFKGDTKINLSSTDGLISSASVSENPLVTVEDGYVSSFDVNVDPQGKGRLGYSVILHLRNALLSQSYDYVEVRVEPSPYQIETVVIAGHEWMCFNATSQDLDEQIYILDGLDSVEDMYNQRFAETVGNQFQYGRPNGYSPWTANNPDAVARPSDSSPWTKPEYMPLPEGYHIASFSEWEDLIPNNAYIPSEYTCRTGERIRATLVTLPGTLVTPVAAINNKKYLMRYVLFESLDTGNKLFIPICSAKTPGSSVLPSYSDFHIAALYWVSNDRACWFMRIQDSGDHKGELKCQESNFNYNGFLSVRGIKDAE